MSTINHNVILKAAREAYRKHWLPPYDESAGDRQASKVTKYWQDIVARYRDVKIEEPVAHELREKIDVVDFSTATAYEMKVSDNNPHHEFYKDIFKVIVYNRNHTENKIRHLVFLTGEYGVVKLRKGLGEAVKKYFEEDSIAIDVVDVSNSKSLVDKPVKKTAYSMSTQWLNYWYNTLRLNSKYNLALAEEFFFIFARFEYSLKIVGYRKREDGEAESDWAKLSKDLEGTFRNPPSVELAKAIDYFMQHPPKKQMVRNSNLKWEENLPPTKLLADKVMIYVRRVRNNLFHGGKFGTQYLEDPERSEELMKYGIVILNSCLDALPKLGAAFGLPAKDVP
jgi:hypothetical protein